jgi:hypothetical protein
MKLKVISNSEEKKKKKSKIPMTARGSKTDEMENGVNV